MKKLLTVMFLCGSVLVSTAQHTTPQLNNQLDSVSYAIGINIAQSLSGGGIDSLNMEMLTLGLQDVMVNGHTHMNQTVASQLVNDYVRSLKEKEAKGAIDAGAAFLAENAKRKGVVTTSSGLQYEIIEKGKGPKPTINSKVTTHYKGTLIDGSIFDSSYDRGKPLSFSVTGVIKGWTEALQLMPQGSKWKLFIPYDLAYGERAMGAKIPAYSTLIFEIELLSIENP